MLWDHVLPTLDVRLQAKDIHNMERVAALYTQGRKQKTSKNGAIFTGDNHVKQENAPPAIQQAAMDFMEDTYTRLEWLKDKTMKEPVQKQPDSED